MLKLTRMPLRVHRTAPQEVWARGFHIQGCLEYSVLPLEKSRDSKNVKALLLSFGQKDESKLLILTLASPTFVSLSPQRGIFLAHNHKIIHSEEVIIAALATVIRHKNILRL